MKRIRFFSVFNLEIKRFARSKAFALLILFSLVWMIALPHLVKSDGTAQGAMEIYIRYSLGGVFTLAAVSLASSGAMTLAREREEKRLQLSMVRPVGFATLALARIAALTAVGAFTLALSAAVLAAKTFGEGRDCWHVLSPDLESAASEAQRDYECYMADPNLPEEIKKTDKSILMRLFTQHVYEKYESIEPGERGRWRFPLDRHGGAKIAARIKFSNDFNIRDEVKGEFSLAGKKGAIDSITRTVATIPLEGNFEESCEEYTLEFSNNGKNSLMLRPRRDINLLVAADGFLWNLVRAYLELVAILAALVSLAVFLGAGLGRSVAVFSIIAFMFVAIASSDIISEYPDPLESDKVDRASLAITRAVDFVARPINSLRPLAALSLDECVERSEVSKVVLVDALMIPLVFSLLAALVIGLKEEGV